MNVSDIRPTAHIMRKCEDLTAAAERITASRDVAAVVG
jgi:hypothetical protein